ncbi:hypothetical protein [Roseovarius sp.]|uniref:DUF7680 family protein n=1 Tax=Roseovarius sp. TaxID=1486281 RepID=UPI0035686304
MGRLSNKLNGDSHQNGSRPRYEIRAKSTKTNGLEISIWQLPSPSAPRLTEPECAGTLKGRPLRLVETAVIKRLRSLGISLARLKPGELVRYPVDEEEAVALALQFRALAPMRSTDRIQTVSTAIDRLSREEANYWLGMALHRKRPRRVLAALRMLLTSP